MSILRPGASGAALVRTPLGADKAGKSLTFTCDMPEGAFARLIRTSYDSLIDSAYHALWQVAQSLSTGVACYIP